MASKAEPGAGPSDVKGENVERGGVNKGKTCSIGQKATRSSESRYTAVLL